MGVDIIIEAATKYITGHSDVMLGIVCARGKHAKILRLAVTALGVCAGPDDLYLAIRGLRTMSLRLKQSEATGLALARMVETQKHVTAVLHPALESSPDHAIYKRDFTGSCGLFGFVLSQDLTQEAIDEAVNGLRLFQIGASWGGFESLITQAVLTSKNRSFASDIPNGYLMRIYAGLEDEGDLIANLQTFFDKLG